MHGLDRIHAKLKTLWAKLTNPKVIQANPNSTLKMILRSQKAKASGTSFRQDLTVTPNSIPFRDKPEEDDDDDDEGMLDDVQDSDEDMRDYDGESEEDEGSLYAPTEPTSELGMEESNNDEDLMKLPPPTPCEFLLLLPREIRDKIYGYVLSLDTPMSEHKLKFRCMSCPGLVGKAKEPTWQTQIHEARNFLRTCHQIRDEGKQVFFDVNSWTLHRARLRAFPVSSPETFHDDTQKLFERLGQIEALKNFKHVNMQISLSPLAYCDITVPDSVALDDPVSLNLFEMSQHPSIIAFHKLDETAQCELFRAAFTKLVANRAIVFPKLRSITLEVSLHAKKIIPDAPKDPLDRCGITFYIRIKLGPRNRASPPSRSNLSLPTLAPKGVIPNNPWLQRAKYAVHSRNVHPSTKGGSWIAPPLEPRRHMLSPLRELMGVQSVQVERCWTVHYRKQGVEDGTMVIHEQPLRRMWRFRSVREMLEKAGPGFGEFLDPAIGYLKISPDEVIEIIENTTEDIGYRIIP